MPCSGTSSVGLGGEVRGREAERAAARVALDDDALDLGRPPEQPGRRVDVALVEQVPDRR